VIIPTAVGILLHTWSRPGTERENVRTLESAWVFLLKQEKEVNATTEI
jgi:hypothetical protein